MNDKTITVPLKVTGEWDAAFKKLEEGRKHASEHLNPLQRGLKSVGEATEGIAPGLSEAASALSKVGLGVGRILGPLGVLAAISMKFARDGAELSKKLDEIHYAAQRAGMSSGSLVQMQRSMRDVGVSTEASAKALGDFAGTMVDLSLNRGVTQELFQEGLGDFVMELNSKVGNVEKMNTAMEQFQRIQKQFPGSKGQVLSQWYAGRLGLDPAMTRDPETWLARQRNHEENRKYTEEADRQNKALAKSVQMMNLEMDTMVDIGQTFLIPFYDEFIKIISVDLKDINTALKYIREFADWSRKTLGYDPNERPDIAFSRWLLKKFGIIRETPEQEKERMERLRRGGAEGKEHGAPGPYHFMGGGGLGIVSTDEPDVIKANTAEVKRLTDFLQLEAYAEGDGSLGTGGGKGGRGRGTGLGGLGRGGGRGFGVRGGGGENAPRAPRGRAAMAQRLGLPSRSAASLADGFSEVDPDQKGRRSYYGGTVTMDGETFHYGTGGGGKGSLPWGTFGINIAGQGGELGPIGRRIGSIATLGGRGGEMYDPLVGNRAGIQIHASSSEDLDRLYSAGCFAIRRSEWPRFKQKLLEMAAKNPSGLALRVGRDGKAQIVTRESIGKGKSTGATAADTFTPSGEGGKVAHDGSGRTPGGNVMNELKYAALKAGVDVNIAHGDEPGHARHRPGASAADLDLFDPKTGRKLDIRNPEDKQKMEAFAKYSVQAGAGGIGFGSHGGYMGTSRMHVGEGTEVAWGEGGAAANAPDWLRQAWAWGRAHRMSRAQITAEIQRIQAERDRAAVEKKSKVTAEGDLNVKVTAPEGTKVRAHGKGLLATVNMIRQHSPRATHRPASSGGGKEASAGDFIAP